MPKRDFKKLNRWIIKFTWNKKNVKIARKTMSKKKKNEDRLALPDNETYYKESITNIGL